MCNRVDSFSCVVGTADGANDAPDNPSLKGA